MTPNPQRSLEMAAGPRRRRVIAGEGMVTPTKPLIFGHERLWPGRARLALDHELVRRRPEAFRAADPSDSATRMKLGEMTRARGPAIDRPPWHL
jgi:hypothetical protein